MYIAYIYDKNDNIIAQVYEILDLNIEQKINDVSNAEFGIYHTNEYCNSTYLKKYRKIRINKQIGNIEKPLFDGVIRGFGMDIEKVSVKLESFEHLLSRRSIHVNYNFVNESIDYILSTILTDINNIYDTGITLDCGITTTTSKEYKTGENLLNILKDLAKNGYEFIINTDYYYMIWNDNDLWDDTNIWYDNVYEKILKFKETIGIDRTGIGDDFIEYRYNYLQPEARTIDRIRLDDDGKELATGVIAKDIDNKVILEDSESKEEYGLIESNEISSGDANTVATSYLENHKNGIKEYDITATSNDFFEVNLGDIAKVYIYSGNDMMYYNGGMKVIKKSFRAGDLEDVRISLNINKTKTKDFIDEFNEIKNKVSKLEL